MNYQHQELAGGKWQKLTFMEQMANIGSEVERTIIWRDKGNEQYSKLAFYRCLELLSLTVDDPHNITRLIEINRVKEMLIDHFMYTNVYHTDDAFWRKYFLAFVYASRLKR